MRQCAPLKGWRALAHLLEEEDLCDLMGACYDVGMTLTRWTVYVTNTVSAAVTVEAEDIDAALDAVYDSPDMPGSITIGAFGPTPVDEDGEWQPVSVADETGSEVWSAQ